MEQQNKETVSQQPAVDPGESVRNMVLNLLDTIQMLTLAIRQLSINQNSIEHYLAEKVMKLPQAEFDKDMAEIKKKVLDELVEQVKDNSVLRKAVKEQQGSQQAAESGLLEKEALKQEKTLPDEHTA